jgi:hypothetical protein
MKTPHEEREIIDAKVNPSFSNAKAKLFGGHQSYSFYLPIRGELGDYEGDKDPALEN